MIRLLLDITVFLEKDDTIVFHAKTWSWDNIS